MKLLAKTNRYYLIYSALLLAIGGIVFFYIISTIIKNEVSEVLKNELSDFLVMAQKDSSRLSQENTVEFDISLTENIRQDTFSDTLVQEGNNEEAIPYLQLTAYRIIEGRPYQIVLRESMIESDEILFGVSISMVILFIVLLLGLVILNTYLSKRLWRPFYANLKQIREFKVSEPDSINIVQSDIKEFEELSTTLIKMTHRIQQDYKSLKQFTENVSHEIQTPLAVIKLNVDWLVQHISDEKQLGNLSKIEMAVNRITRTNQALLLLTKIENNQFEEKAPVSISSSIKQGLTEYEDFIEARKLNVSVQATGTLKERVVNKQLFQILVNNLINNAVKHNVQNGFINIFFNNQELIIENSGKEINIDPNQLFNRFVKGDQSSQSSGLGLSIAETIARIMSFRLLYSTDGMNHKMVVTLGD